MRGRFIIVIVLFALVATSMVNPMLVNAQETENQQEEKISFWDREFIGLQVMTWAVIIGLIIVVSVVLEGLGWVFILLAIGYILWLLLI